MGWHGLVRSRIRYPLLANAVQRLPTVWWDKTVRRQIVCSRRVPYGDAARWPNVAHNALAEDPGHTRPERHFPSGAAQTRIVSAARIRLDPRKSVRPFKGIICGDISEFESFMASHAVRSLSDIRFAEIRAPQMLVGQKGEEALDLINPALCSTRSAISVLAVRAKINVARAGGREHPAAAARGLSIYGSRCPPISSHG